MIDAKRQPIAAREAGSAIVELAVMAPLLLLLLLGVVDLGRFADAAIKVGNAARAGVQFGAQNEATAGDTQGMQNAANADAQLAALTAVAAPTFCQCADGTVSTCQQGDCASSHRIQWVQVTATGTFSSGLDASFIPPTLRSITISQTAVMQVAQ
jgi:Flp pilus assembly protein TadG